MPVPRVTGHGRRAAPPQQRRRRGRRGRARGAGRGRGRRAGVARAHLRRARLRPRRRAGACQGAPQADSAAPPTCKRLRNASAPPCGVNAIIRWLLLRMHGRLCWAICCARGRPGAARARVTRAACAAAARRRHRRRAGRGDPEHLRAGRQPPRGPGACLQQAALLRGARRGRPWRM